MQCLAHVFGSGAADIVNRLDRNLAAIGLFVILAAVMRYSLKMEWTAGK